ncbi:MAG: O-antigen ligase family protein [Anaerolineae bacterium]|jgi:putative inorganic carbon (HCO3(-)) transporter|nr:O-antigen ligase family protein [Anaerolineae bacterium]
MHDDGVIGRAARTITRWQVPILLLASPLFLFARPSLTPALVLLPLLWLARSRARGRFVPRTPVEWPILGLLVMTLLSMWATPDLPTSLPKIAGLAYAIALFYALVDWGQGAGRLLPAALLSIALAAGTAGLSLLGVQWNVKWPLLKTIVSALPQVLHSLPGAEAGFNPNTVSGTLITFIPLQLACLWGLRPGLASIPRRRVLALGVGLSLALTGLVVLLAQSRAAWMALFIGLACLVAVVSRRFRPVLLLVVVSALVVLAIAGPVAVSEWLAEQGWMAGSAEMSWQARVEHWSRWLWAIADHPLTGMGMDIFRWSGTEIYPFFHWVPGSDLGHAHNGFLHTALDLGLPGLVSYLALLGTTLVLGWQSHRQASDAMARLLLLGGTLGLATHAAWSLVDALPLGARTNFLWWAVAALVVVGIVREQREGADAATDPGAGAR